MADTGHIYKVKVVLINTGQSVWVVVILSTVKVWKPCQYNFWTFCASSWKGKSITGEGFITEARLAATEYMAKGNHLKSGSQGARDRSPAKPN